MGAIKFEPPTCKGACFILELQEPKPLLSNVACNDSEYKINILDPFRIINTNRSDTADNIAQIIVKSILRPTVCRPLMSY